MFYFASALVCSAGCAIVLLCAIGISVLVFLAGCAIDISVVVFLAGCASVPLAVQGGQMTEALPCPDLGHY